MKFKVKTETFIAILRAAVIVRKDITILFTKTSVGAAMLASDQTAYINYTMPCEGDGEVEVSFDATMLINALKIFTEDEVEVTVGDVIKVVGGKHRVSVPKYIAAPSFSMKPYSGRVIATVRTKDILDVISVMGDAQDVRFEADDVTIKCGVITGPATSIIVDLDPSPYDARQAVTATFSPILMKDLSPILKKFETIQITFDQDKPIEFVGDADESHLRLFIANKLV